jgi:hypothetical protein
MDSKYNIVTYLPCSVIEVLLKCPRTIKALHWVPIPMPMPTQAHGFWVGMGAMLLFMGGHGFCASLHPTPNWSQTSQMQGIR